MKKVLTAATAVLLIGSVSAQDNVQQAGAGSGWGKMSPAKVAAASALGLVAVSSMINNEGLTNTRRPDEQGPEPTPEPQCDAGDPKTADGQYCIGTGTTTTVTVSGTGTIAVPVTVTFTYAPS